MRKYARPIAKTVIARKRLLSRKRERFAVGFMLWGSDVFLCRITPGFTGHERKFNHFTPARMSALCATLCYPAFPSTSPTNVASQHGFRETLAKPTFLQFVQAASLRAGCPAHRMPPMSQTERSCPQASHSYTQHFDSDCILANQSVGKIVLASD